MKDDAKALGVESLLTVIAEKGAEALKEDGMNVLVEAGVDLGASMIPGIGGLYTSYKQKRLQANIESFNEALVTRIEELQMIFYSKTQAQKNDIDRLFELVMDYMVDEPQQEKIEYLVNGFVNLADHEELKEDFILVFYDTLKELRMIDLTVIRLYGRHYLNDDEERVNSYLGVLEEQGISYEQYETIRRNLVRKGILTTKTDVIIEKDLVAIEKAIVELQSFMKKATDPKNKSRLPTLKTLKIKSKDSLVLTKFGRDFIQCFLNKQEKE